MAGCSSAIYLIVLLLLVKPLGQYMAAGVRVAPAP